MMDTAKITNIRRANTSQQVGVLGRLASLPFPARHAFLAVLLSLVFTRAIPHGGSLVMIGCALYALRGRKEAIQGLALMFLILMAGVAWGAKDVVGDIRWLVLFAAAISAGRGLTSGFKLKEHVLPIVVMVSFYAVIFIVIGVLVSRYPTISVFKLISFWLGAVTLMACFSQAKVSKNYWRFWFSGWFFAILFCGVLCIAWGGGFLKNGTGFEGMFDHPQTNGVVLGTGAAFFLSQYLLRSTDGKLEGLLGLFMVVAVYFSQSRTGLFALMLAASLSCFLLWLKYRQKLSRTRLFKHTLLLGIGAFCIVAALPFQVSSLMSEFVSKGGDDSKELSSAFTESRQDLVDRGMANFRQNPVVGIGFGAPSSNFTKIKTFMGFPIGASVEKGFLPAAVLEETGVLGAVGLSLLLVLIFLKQLGTSIPYFLWPMSTAILCNLGEAMFFSIGGLGLFVWMMIGLTIAGDGAKAKPAKRSDRNRSRKISRSGNVTNRVKSGK